jgi:uncharacterized metal-binding protein YceD (DUF177 family)
VDYLKNFVIPFVGLGIGDHQFEFMIDDKFFACYEYSEIKQAQVRIDLNVEKSDRMLVFTFRMAGTLRVTCSRCLDEFDMPVEGEEVLYLKYGNEYKEEDDDVIIIPETESQINIAPFIYDYLSLMVPYRVVHPENENGETACDPDVINRISNTSEQKDTDPRWDKLKNLNID